MKNFLWFKCFIQQSIWVAWRMRSCFDDYLALQASLASWPACANWYTRIRQQTHADWQHSSHVSWPSDCLYYSTSGYYIAHCPVWPTCPIVSHVYCPNVSTSPLTSNATLTASDIPISVIALLNSGSLNFHIRLVTRLQVKKIFIPLPLSVPGVLSLIHQAFHSP